MPCPQASFETLYCNKFYFFHQFHNLNHQNIQICMENIHLSTENMWTLDWFLLKLWMSECQLYRISIFWRFSVQGGHFFDFHLPWLFLDLREISLTSWYKCILVKTDTYIKSKEWQNIYVQTTCLNSLTFLFSSQIPWLFPDVLASFHFLWLFPDFQDSGHPAVC